MEIKNINDGINWRTIPKEIKDEFVKNGHLREETHRRNEKGETEVTYGKIMRPMFVHYNYESLDFYVNDKYIDYLYEPVDLGIVFDEDLNTITRKNIKPFYDEYSKGFNKGYSEFEETLKKDVPFFGISNEHIVYKIYSRIINEKKGSFPIYSTFILQKSELEKSIIKEKNLKVLLKLNKKSFFNSGFEGGEFYKAWEIILNNPTVFEPIFKKYSQHKTGSQPELLHLSHASVIENDKAKKLKKVLLQFIHNIKNKEEFIQELKETFPTEIGKSIKAIIDILRDEKILVYGTKEFKNLYEEIKLNFNREIGTYNSIQNVKIVDEETTDTVRKKLTTLIIKYKTS